MMGYGGYGMGGGMFFGAILWIVLFVVIVYAFVHLFRTEDRGPSHRGSPALDVLEERYARGEIGRDEYLEKKGDLSTTGHERKR